MPGKHKQPHEIKALKDLVHNKGFNVAQAAKAVGMCWNTAQKILKEEHFSNCDPMTTEPRESRHADAESAIWKTKALKLLNDNPKLRAKSVFKEIKKLDPKPKVSRRTVERLVKKFKTDLANGKIHAKREKVPGREAQVDFKNLDYLEVTINGQLLKHNLFHIRFVYSGRIWCAVTTGGESRRVLFACVVKALRTIGGVPQWIRTDNMSPAFRNSGEVKGKATDAWQEFAAHYNFVPKRIRPRCSWQNGSVESGHRHVSADIEDALALRGSKDFPDKEEYQEFIYSIVKSINDEREDEFKQEKAELGPLPDRHYPVEGERSVDKQGLIEFNSVFYSVPQSARGGKVSYRVIADRFLGYRQGKQLFDHPLGQSVENGGSKYVIDFRHLLDDYLKMPCALPDLDFLEQFFPAKPYLDVLDLTPGRLTEKEACKLALDLLVLARKHDCVDQLAVLLSETMARGHVPDLNDMERAVRKGNGTASGERQSATVSGCKILPANNETSITGKAASIAETPAATGSTKATPSLDWDASAEDSQHEHPRRSHPAASRYEVSQGMDPNRKLVILKSAYERRVGRLKKVGRQYQGPCPVCGGTDRFSLRIPDGLFQCRECYRRLKDSRIICREICGALGVHCSDISDGEEKSADTAQDKAGKSRPGQSEETRLRKAWYVYKYSVSIVGTAGEEYLNSRGIFNIPDGLRFKADAWYQVNDKEILELPCIVAKIIDPATGKFRGVSKTFFTMRKKFKRRARGFASGNGVLVQGSINDEIHSVVEGLEDALSLVQAGVEGAVWAAGGINHMAKFNAPEAARILFIGPDNEEKAHDAAWTLMDRHGHRLPNFDCWIASPSAHDWNDMLVAGRTEEIRREFDPAEVFKDQLGGMPVVG